jgi:small GTP-binding protein
MKKMKNEESKREKQSEETNFIFEIRHTLENTSDEGVRLFVWLCLVRAIPFLGTTNNFDFWPRANKDKYLYSIFYIMDYLAASIMDCLDDRKDTLAILNESRAFATMYANFVSTLQDAVIDISTSATAESYVSIAACYAADAAENIAIILNAYQQAANDPAYKTNAVYTSSRLRGKIINAAINVATYSAKAALDNKKVFEQLLIDDLHMIGHGYTKRFEVCLTLYTYHTECDIRKNFISLLHKEGYGYWAELYENIISNGFKLNIDALERRCRVPLEIAEKGAKAVAAYLELVEAQGLVFSQRETRVIILGSAGAGKTTLVKRLNGDYDFPNIQDSTHGVDTSVEIDCNGTKAHIWDFGGQVIYHASHRCFMYANCVYILVVNARTEDNRDSTRVKYWLDTIRIYSHNKAKVFLIINTSDNRIQNASDYYSFMTGEYAFLIQNIYSFNIGHDISSVISFKKDLSFYIETIGHQSFGKKDSDIIEALKDLFHEHKIVLEIEELKTLLIKCDIKTKRDQDRVIELLNTLGVALSYPFMEGFVLDPYWISHGVYKVIDYLQKNQSMFISPDDLDEVFMGELSVYPQNKNHHILELMEHYKIGFRNIDGVHGLIVPCAASQLRPEYITDYKDHDNIVTRIERDDLQEFPADFFYRYICSNHRNIEKNNNMWSMWQTGMVLTVHRASALVELKENRRIEITVWGDKKKEYKRELVLLIDDLLKEYHFIPHKEKRKSKNGKFVEIITLVFEAIAKGSTKALVENSAGNTIKELVKNFFH